MLPKLYSMKESGKPCPALDDQPQPTEFNAFALDLFFFLNNSRGFDGMGGFPLPITISAIHSMLELECIHCVERRLWYMTIIQAADGAYIEQWTAKHGTT